MSTELKDLVNDLAERYNLHRWNVADLLIKYEGRLHARYSGQKGRLEMRDRYFVEAAGVLDRYYRRMVK